MSDIQRLLVPIDGSPTALAALRHALSLAAHGLAVEIHLLNVQPPVRGVAASLVGRDDLASYHRDEGMACLAEARALVEAAGLVAHLHVAVGSPGEIVCAFVQRLAAAQVVMGTRGLGTVGGAVLGSVANHVVVHAGVPVTLVHR